MNLYLIAVTDDAGSIAGAMRLLDLLERSPAHLSGCKGRVGILLRLPLTSDADYSAVAPRFVSRVRALGLLPILHGTRGEKLAGDDLGIGVHFPEREWRDRGTPLLPRFFVSAACHDEDGALLAEKRGATSIVLSPIFATPGKGAPLGIRPITRTRLRLSSGTRLFALGGVDVSNASLCRAAGAHGIAAVRAITSAEDPARAIAGLLHRFL